MEDSGSSVVDAESLVVSAKDGKWHHAVMTFSRGSTNTVNFYLDGVNVGTTTTANVQGSVTNSSVPLNIGRFEDSSGTVKWMDGEIRQVRLHNRALSADEVRAAYSGQAVSYEYTGASQANLVTNPLNSAYSPDSNWAKQTGWAINTTTNPTKAECRTTDDYSFYNTPDNQVKGKRYRITFTISDYVSGGVTVDDDYNQDRTLFDENGTHTHEYTATTTHTIFFGQNGTTTNLDISDISVVQLGCVAEYLPTGINSTQWVDTSGNGLNGSTSTATAVNHEVGTITATGVVEVNNGIKFPATAVASADANTLDDYEEGTWTPVAIGTTSNPTAPSAWGTYTKIGRLVTVDFYVQWAASGVSAGVGDLKISGLPYNSDSAGTHGQSGVIAYAWGWGTANRGAPSSLYVHQGTDDLMVRVADSDLGNKTVTAVESASAADVTNSTLFGGSITYRV